MSRCFPFPPPGYEPRPRSEHKDLLKKEQHKGKKQRKEKDSKKGDRKQKDRGHSNDKHNKKLKREKHREKRKNKDRDKHNYQSLEEETEKNGDFDNRIPDERGQNEAVKDIKPTGELVPQFPGLPRNTNAFGATGYKEKETSLSRMVKKSGTLHNHGMLQKNNSIAYTDKKGMEGGVDSKTRVKNGKSFQVASAEKHFSRRHGSKGMDLPQDSSKGTPSPNTLQRAEEVGQHPKISAHCAYEKNDRISNKGMIGKENQSSDNCCGNMDQQFVQKKHAAVEGVAKTKEAQTNYLKAVKSKYRDRDVKKRKSSSNNKVKEVEKNGNINEQKKVDGMMLLACPDEHKFVCDDIKKRKDLDANSSLHENRMRTTKLPRMSPTNPKLANGEISPHSRGIAPYSSTELVGADTCEVDRHEPRGGYISGIIDARYLEGLKVPGSSSDCDSNKGYLKPPHPDSKYLSQVHFLPAMEDFPKSIDQDWLFSEDRVERKTATYEAAESGQVWSNAQRIDIADVVALPYVVPL